MNFLRFDDLKARGIVKNRMTLWRWIERGIFPPPVDLGPNSRAWDADDDLAEYDQRVKAGIIEPNPKWLARVAERRARAAARDQAA